MAEKVDFSKIQPAHLEKEPRRVRRMLKDRVFVRHYFAKPAKDLDCVATTGCKASIETQRTK